MYPGIDLIYYGNQRRLEYDFVVTPGADPNRIRFALQGSGQTTLSPNGDLVVQTTNAEIRMRKPVIYQTIGQERREVNGRFVLLDQHEIGFAVGAYDRRLDLVIDPILDYATYLDRSVSLGEGAYPRGFAIDEAGNAYITGPTCPDITGRCDAFVSKLNSAGSAIVYTAYLGGTGNEDANAIAVDAKGSAYVTGYAGSRDFPTVNAFQPVIQSTALFNVFVSKLSADGTTLVYSTYLGGNNYDEGLAIAVDTAGSAYVTGYSKSPDFPVVNAFQRTYGGTQDVFLSKFTPEGTALVYSTYLGGGIDEAAQSIAIDREGNAYITGATQSSNFPTVNPFQRFPSRYMTNNYDGFVSKFNASGTALLYSTYFGGGGLDVGMAIAVDSEGRASVTGATYSTDFPIANALYGFPSTRCYNAFVTKFSSDGSALVYSTQFGKDPSTVDVTQCAEGLGVAIDSADNTYVTGYTSSVGLPNANPLQAAHLGKNDAFVAKLNPSGSVLFATYLGGNESDKGLDIAVDRVGNAFVMGETQSVNFPTTTMPRPRSAQASVFLVKITDADPLSYSIAQRSGVAMTSQGGFGATTIGYARIQPFNGTTTPAGLAIFGFRQNDTLATEAAIPASGRITAGRIFAEFERGVNTGIAIVNPNDFPVTLNFYFTNSNGQNSAVGLTTIAANGQLARFLNESPFSPSISNYLGTLTFIASAPVSAIALRSLTNECSEFLLTTLPVIDLSAAFETQETGPIVIPQYAQGGGWTTQILLVNPTDHALHGSIEFFGPGSSVSPGRPTSAPLSYTVPARSSIKVRTAGESSSILTGWIRVVPDANNETPSGLAIFSFRRDGVTVGETGVGALRTGNAFRVYAQSEGNFNAGEPGSMQTGLAIANPSVNPAVVAFELKTFSGESTGVTGSVIVPANGQTSIFLRQIPGFVALPNAFQGVLRVSTASSSGISVFAFRGRYNERTDFLITATPPANEIDPVSTSELFFPNFVDGGGYTTQLILFNRSDNPTASGFLRFFTQTGVQFRSTVGLNSALGLEAVR